ncbi:MAG TPA: ferritin-like domain-containing protein [Acidobacteriota bacterium]|nr:ferritin-like domain-containing protein [Acidobacteriota bacterium]
MAQTMAKTGPLQADQAKVKEIIRELTRSYWMEIETVQNYIANSVNLEGVRAKEIKESLGDDVEQELSHARRLAERIHVLGGVVPGSMEFRAEQQSIQPPKESTDVISVIRGVIQAEDQAIEQYSKIIELCDQVDWATQDMCIELMADEQGHRREFISYLAEYDREEARKLATV